MEYRISVLMGIYNCASTLSEAIDSLYAQTYKNFKLILCDDGSTDNTYEIAEKYAKQYNNIILLRNKRNMKLAHTLNHCLEYADTEFVARMDGDDISLPKRFEKQVSFLDSHQEYVVVSCNMIHFDETGEWGEGKTLEKPDINTFKRSTPHPHAPSMTRTSIMKEVGGYTLSKYLERGQDYYLWFKIYKAGYKGYNIQESLYKMRDNKDAMTRRTFKSRWNGFIVKRQVLKDLGIRNATINSLPEIIKAFIPRFLMKALREKRMKSSS